MLGYYSDNYQTLFDIVVASYAVSSHRRIGVMLYGTDTESEDKGRDEFS